MWSARAQAEGLTLLEAANTTGFLGVYLKPGKPKPYQARVSRGGKEVSLGCFTTAEEAALCFARSPEGQVVAQKVAAAPPTSEDARQQAQAEGLTLRKANYNSTSGYFGVHFKPAQPKPYAAQMRRGGKLVHLGTFATAEEAALCVARSPEGQVAAAAESRGTLPAVPSGAVPQEKAMAPGAVVTVEALLLLLDDDLELDECIGWHGRDDALLVKEEEGSDVRPKRQREK